MMRDFDQFIEERRKRSNGFTLFGKDYILPPTIPYDAVLRFQALSKRKRTDTIKDEELFQIFESLVGKETLEELRAYREFDVELMIEVMNYIFEVYNITDKGQSKEKKAE